MRCCASAILAYLKPEQRFALVANRFDWASTAQSATKAKLEFKRRRAGLRFERVRNAQLHDVDLKNKEAALELLAICWEAGPEPPEGFVTLHFAGGGAIRLHVECIEAEMKDLGAAWTTKLKPRHPDCPAGRRLIEENVLNHCTRGGREAGLIDAEVALHR